MHIKWNTLANVELKPIGNYAINSYQTMIGYILVINFSDRRRKINYS